MTVFQLLFPVGFLAYLEISFRLVLAAGLAALLISGLDSKDRLTSLKAYMLVALAAAVFTVLALAMLEAAGPHLAVTSDPTRIIAAVTASIALLAAGTICQGHDKPRKRVTAGARIWMAGALGVAAGAGYYGLAVMAAVLSLVILFTLSRLETPPRLTLIDENEEAGDSG